MASLTLSKLYADTELLNVADINTMWTELEAFTNSGINDDVLVSGWSTIGALTLARDTTYTMGATNSGSVTLSSSTNDMTWNCTLSTLFKVGGTQVGQVDYASNDFLLKQDVYFKDSSTSYSFLRVLGTYQKPVLVYVDSDSIDVENNCETANQSLIVFPFGPMAVNENTASTHKMRRLKLSATANGYGSTHTGDADSGLRVGLSLSANTWYFVYAVNIRYGNDANNGFILVVDDTDPAYSNEGTLDGRYGSGQWVYLGTIRRGYGGAATTTLVPFMQDHQGWTYFTDRDIANDYLGLQFGSAYVSSATTSATVFTFSVGNSGYAFPAHLVACKAEFVGIEDGDSYIGVVPAFYVGDGTKLINLPAQGSDSSITVCSTVKVPILASATFKAVRYDDASSDDFNGSLVISGFQDHLV